MQPDFGGFVIRRRGALLGLLALVAGLVAVPPGGAAATADGEPSRAVLLFQRAYLQHEMVEGGGAEAAISAASSEWPHTRVFTAVGRADDTVDVYEVLDSRLEHFATVNGQPGSSFGAAVAVGFGGGLLAVGAPDFLHDGKRTGAVHVYQRTTGGYQQLAQLRRPGAADEDQFGAAVSVGGNDVVVGSPRADTDAGDDAGSVDVYRWADGTVGHHATLAPAEPRSGDRFGAAVSASAMHIVAGAPYDDVGDAIDAGSVTTFTSGPEGEGPWALRATVTERGGAVAGAHYGAAVSSRGGGAAVGAPDADGGRGHVALMHNLHSEPVTSGVYSPPAGIRGFGTVVSSGHGAWAVGAAGGEQDTPTAWLLTEARPDGRVRRVPLRTPEEQPLGPVVTLPGVDTAVAADATAGALHAFETGRRLSRAADALDDRHGESVDVDGATAIVGTPSQEATVYALHDGAWSRSQTLSSPGDSTGFGNGVAVDGDTAVVAAAPSSASSGRPHGSVHVYRRTHHEWVYEAHVQPPAEDAAEYFGAEIALEGDTLVVTAPGSERPGRAYVYRRAGPLWLLETTLSAPAGAAGGRFGDAVDIDGATVVIGAPGIGRAYEYTRTSSGWGSPSELRAPAARPVGNFGFAVAVHGGTVVVSSRTLDGQLTGSVEIFTADGDDWAHQQSLETTYQQEDEFGHALSIEDGVLVVGAPRWGSTPDFGRADVFEWQSGQWELVRRPGGAVRLSEGGNRFGSDVALKDGSIIVGAPGGSWGPPGAAYAYDVRRIDPGGPYTAAEGGTVELDASATHFPHDGDERFSWDLDGDSRYGETGDAAARGDEAGARVTALIVGRPAGSTAHVRLAVSGEHGVGGGVEVPIAVTNSPPHAEANGPYRGESASYVAVEATGSWDPGGTRLTYDWDFDADGAFDDEDGSRAVFRAPAGEYEIALRVTDPSGATAVDTASVKVLQSQTVFASPSAPLAPAGKRITFIGEAKPARPRQPIHLERRVDGTWTTEVRSTTDDGTFTIRTPVLESGRPVYRVTTPGDDDHVAASSDRSALSVYRVGLRVRTSDSVGGESVRIRNTGVRPVQLRYWTLDARGGRTVSLPRYRLEPGSGVRVHTGRGRNAPGHIYLGESVRLWRGATGTARLRDLYGHLAAQDDYGS